MPATGRNVITFGAPLLVLSAVVLSSWLALGSTQTSFGPMRLTPLPVAAPSSAPLDPESPPATTLEAITPIQAELKNALLPYSHSPLLPGAGFHATADLLPAATECMTEAIYYEAGHEPEAGKRAVAQVILNRAASPAFPHSVCGVVQQGAKHPGCQFTFMCDGSLGRHPNATSWEGARQIAQQALNGVIDADVGAATHYHADYVFPTWAPQMVKLIKIGHHIFYRWKGALLITQSPPVVGSPALGQSISVNLPEPPPRLETLGRSAIQSPPEGQSPAYSAPGISISALHQQGNPQEAGQFNHPGPYISLPHSPGTLEVRSGGIYRPHRALPEGSLQLSPLRP